MNDLLDSFNDTALNGLGIPGLSGFSGGAGVLEGTYNAPGGGSAGLYNAPQAQSYNAPQAQAQSYNAPQQQVGYNAPAAAYNANLLLSGQRFDLSLPSNNHVPQMQVRDNWKRMTKFQLAFLNFFFYIFVLKYQIFVLIIIITIIFFFSF